MLWQQEQLSGLITKKVMVLFSLKPVVAGFKTLNENEKITYELINEKGKTSAGNLQKA